MILKKNQKKKKNLKNPKTKKAPNNHLEIELKIQGYKYIFGIDEVGRGALAGPLISCALRLPNSKRPYKIRDSKQLSFKKRADLAKKLASFCDYGFGIVSPNEINSQGLSWALEKSYLRAISQLKTKPDHLLIDGIVGIKKSPCQQTKIIRGDQKISSIAAASILAKVYRDEIMIRLAKLEPRFGFEKHMGYGTKYHREMIYRFGPSPHHRHFGFIKELI
jgi:ribonuclease HII